MFQMDFNGRTVNVCEHMKELKGLNSNLEYILGRFYNKKQLLKYYLGKYTFTDCGDTEEGEAEECLEEDEFGSPCGGEAVNGSRIGDYYIIFYKLEDIGRDEDEVEEVLFQLGWGGTFLKADDGQIYFINWNVD